MFNPNSDTYRFLEQNMMLNKNEDWNPDGDEGRGDALWRTSVSYIAYGNKRLKDGILSCFRKFTMINKEGKHWYQGARFYNRFREDDVSRDQTILALSALKINNAEEFKEIVAHLPYKLSRRFSMGPTMFVWLKAISTNKRSWNYLFQILELIEFIPSVLWNKLLRWVMGWDKQYSQDYYLSFDNSIGFYADEDGEEKWIIDDDWYWVNAGQRMNINHQRKSKKNKLYKILYAMEYPEYALHLTSWMTYVSRDTFLKKIIQKLGIWLAEKDNLLVRKLMGDTVTDEEIDKYKPTKGYRWSGRYNGTGYTNYVEGDDALYNTIDKDILLFDRAKSN